MCSPSQLLRACTFVRYRSFSSVGYTTFAHLNAEYSSPMWKLQPRRARTTSALVPNARPRIAMHTRRVPWTARLFIQLDDTLWRTGTYSLLTFKERARAMNLTTHWTLCSAQSHIFYKTLGLAITLPTVCRQIGLAQILYNLQYLCEVYYLQCRCLPVLLFYVRSCPPSFLIVQTHCIASVRISISGPILSAQRIYLDY